MQRRMVHLSSRRHEATCQSSGHGDVGRGRFLGRTVCSGKHHQTRTEPLVLDLMLMTNFRCPGVQEIIIVHVRK